MGKACCGFGHRDLLCNIKPELDTIIEELITEKGINVFYVGNQGEFDKELSSCIRRAKTKHPDILLILVIPYLTKKLNQNKEYYDNMYDDVILYEGEIKVHPKAAFYKRNRYMVEKSDYVIAYLYRTYGGAYDAVNYAKKCGKTVIYLKKVREH